MTDEIARRMAKRMDELMAEALFGPVKPPRRTCLRLRGNSFEVVELDDSGKIIEPVRCICGAWAVYHRAPCPFAYGVT